MKRTKYTSAACSLAAACTGLLLPSLSLRAQEVSQQAGPPTQSAGELQEIIVTARKREESILNVPVIEAAIPEAELDRLQAVEVTDLPSLVPGLQFGRAVMTIGSEASIRGIGTTSLDQGVDQSVALNIDGMAPGSGLAFQSALFDLQQVEVLKGPQALFFGKSSPAGVISLRTADPTNQFDITARTAYEFEAHTAREEAIFSGPLTDTLEARLAAMYSTSDGFFYNKGFAEPNTGAVTPTDERAPRSRDYIIRETTLWNPNEQLGARLKLNLVNDYAVQQEAYEDVDCPLGAGFAPAGHYFIGTEPGNCQGLSRNIYTIWLDPSAYPSSPLPNGGVPFTQTQQEWATLELNYRPTPQLTVTSVTADYLLRSDALGNAAETTGAGSPFAAINHFHRRELTQELRMNSDFSSPLNFTLGAFYEDGRITQINIVPLDAALGIPAISLGDVDPVTIKTWSAFGQARWQIVSRLELAVGLRWSDETRTESPLSLSGAPVDVLQPRVHANNDSPEFTITYRPTDDLTTFASWKQGFKSGSFSISAPIDPGANNAFGEETIRGAEMGVKSRWLERRLSASLAGYYYNYSGLQVGASVPSTDGAIVVQTVNAGAARIYGLDFDGAYQPAAVDGLAINAALDWKHARYRTLDNVPCWGGQTIALGCNQIYNSTTGLYTAQNLAGTPLLNAPAWQAQFGFNHEYALPRGYKVELGNNNAFSSRYTTFLAVGRPNSDNYQGSYIKSDVNLSILGPRDSWELSLIGKDLSNKITTNNCGANDQAVGGFFVDQTSGGLTSGRDGLGQMYCFADPGRQVWLRLTVRPLAGIE